MYVCIYIYEHASPGASMNLLGLPQEIHCQRGASWGAQGAPGGAPSPRVLVNVVSPRRPIAQSFSPVPDSDLGQPPIGDRGRPQIAEFRSFGPDRSPRLCCEDPASLSGRNLGMVGIDAQVASKLS